MAWTVRSRWGPPRQLKFTRSGVFYVVLTLGMGLAGINTGNNLVMLTCGVMLGLIIASGTLSERCLRDLDVTREFPDQLAAGTESLVVVAISNAKRYSSFGILVSEVAGKGQAYFPLIRPGETERRAYRVTPSSRGTLHTGEVRLSTAFPFGLFEKSLILARPQDALVAPPVIASPLPTGRPRDGLGEHGSPGEGGGTDPWELRLHRSGQDVRRIAWAQSARAGRLLSLTREKEGLTEARLVIQAQPTAEARERHLGRLRHQAETLLASGLAVSLAAGADGAVELVPAGSGDAQRAKILRALAREPGGEVSATGGAIAESAPLAPLVGVSRFIRFQRGFLFAVVGVAFLSLLASRELPIPVGVAFGLVFLYAIPRRESATAGFAQMVNLLTLVILLILVGFTIAKVQNIPLSASELVLLLCANRLLVRRAPADDALLHLTTFLVLAAGAALGSELEYAFALLAFCALTPTSLLLSELRRGIEQDAAARASALMTSPELTAPSLLGLASALGGLTLTFGVVLFPLFPRAQLGLLQALSTGGPRVSGVSDNVDLSAGGPIHGSSKVVLRVDIRAGDPEALHYFRAVTLDHFTGSGWLPSARHSSAIRTLSVNRQPIVNGELEPFSGAGEYLPVPEGLTDLRSEVFGLYFRSDLEGDLRLEAAPPGALLLEFDAAEERSRGAEQIVAEDLVIPELPPAAVALAAELIPEGTAPKDAIRRIQRHFASYHYNSDVPGGDDALATFFATRTGECQLFATAAVVMLRARGIPARYVGGYYLDSPHRGQNLVRAWDAHAWTEVLTPDGPLLLDATPASERGGHRQRDPAWQSVVDFWQAAQFHWLRSVVDYDYRSQVNQASWLMTQGQRLWRGGRSKGRFGWGSVLVLVLGALLAAALVRGLRGRRDPARRLEDQIFARLSALGVLRMPGMTYEDALAALQTTQPNLVSRAAPLLQRIGRARFGGDPLELDERLALSRAIDRLV